MNTRTLLTGATGPGMMAGRSTITRIRILLTLLLLLALPGLAQAQFEYTVDNGTVTITKYTGPGGDVVIPDTINGFPVINIGHGAFYRSQHLSSLAIPDSVTYIGGFAFYDCTGLTIFTLPDHVTYIGDSAFYGCAGLTSFTIPNSATTIGQYAFYGCRGLSNVTIPENVTGIGWKAFANCMRLTAINVAALNSDYGSVDGVLFNKDQTALIQCPGGKAGIYTIPEHVTSIGHSAFSGCRGLTSVTIEKGVRSIELWAFEGCYNLTAVTVVALNPVFSSVEGVLFNKSQTELIGYPAGKAGESYSIPESVTSIMSWAFSECTQLANVTIPDSVTSIGYSAFHECMGLRTVMIGNGVTSIDESVFYGCIGLTSVTIGKGVRSIGMWAFKGRPGLKAITVAALNPVYSSVDGVLFNKNQTELIEYPRGKAGIYSIPDSVTSIRSLAFAGCKQLAHVTIGGSVTSIDDWAFSETSLTSVTLPSSVTRVKWGAFSDCASLISVTFGSGIASIEGNALRGCANLIAVYFHGDAPDLGNGVFEDTNATIYYLPGTSGWGPTFGGRPTAPWHVNPAPFEYTISNGTITITGYNGPGGHVIIPSSINDLPVTAIGENAFEGWRSDVTSITIPDGVTSIGEGAFYRCNGLRKVWIPESVTTIGNGAFADCLGLTNIAIPDSVTSLGEHAFARCTALSSVTIGERVSGIGDFSFFECSSLTSVNLPDSITSIGLAAFYNCSSLTSVTMGENVASIGSDAFYRCTNLISFATPDRVTSLDAFTFFGCHSLTIVTIGNSVTNIGPWAFSGCTSLTSIDVPDSVASIGGYAFEHCTNMTSATIGSGVAIIGSAAFGGCTSLVAAFFRCDAPDVGPSYSEDPRSISPFGGTSATIYYLLGTSGWGAEYWGRPTIPWSLMAGDVDGDGKVDRDDLAVIVHARNTAAFGPEDARDLDGDGMITVLDARTLVTLFTVPPGFTRVASSHDGVLVEWNENASVMTLQSTSDLRSGTWENVGRLQSSTNAVVGTTAERMFFRLVLPE